MDKKTYAQKVIGDVGYPALRYRERNGSVYQVPSKEEEGTITPDCDTNNSTHNSDVSTLSLIPLEIREAHYAVKQSWPKRMSKWDKKIQAQIEKDKEALLTRLEHGGILVPATAPGAPEPRQYYAPEIEYYYRPVINRGRKWVEKDRQNGEKGILCRHEEDKFLSDFILSTREEANMIASMLCSSKAVALQTATKEFAYTVKNIPVMIRGNRSPLCIIRDCPRDESASKNDVTTIEILKTKRESKIFQLGSICDHEINVLLKDFVKTIKIEAKTLLKSLPSDEKATIESAIRGIANVAEWIQFRNSEKINTGCDITVCKWRQPEDDDLVFKMSLNEHQESMSDVNGQMTKEERPKPYVAPLKTPKKEVLESLAMVASRLHKRRLSTYENLVNTNQAAKAADLDPTPEMVDEEIDIAAEQTINPLKQG